MENHKLDLCCPEGRGPEAVAVGIHRVREGGAGFSEDSLLLQKYKTKLGLAGRPKRRKNILGRGNSLCKRPTGVWRRHGALR